MPWKVEWSVSVDGRDVSSAWNDWLRSIEIHEKEGDGGDTADLELDDTGGTLLLPRAGASVVIALGARRFVGFTEEPEWSFTRGAGRSFSVHCTAHDSRGPVKDQQRWHQDGGTLGDFLGKAGKQAGIVSVVVAPAFASIARDWWSPSGASFMAVGRRLADELGGVFRIRGDKAVLAERGAGASASGTALPPVVFDCRAGTVESVKGKPFTGGASRTKAKVRWFDRKEGKWKAEEVEVDPVDGAPPSVAHGRYPQADAGRAKGRAKGRKDQAAHDKGQMAVKSDFRDDVSVGAPASIVNARPGVDGAYTVKEATHKAERGGGSSSEFELVRPSGTAGKDTRKKTTATKTSSGPAEAGAVPASSVA